MTQGLVCKNDEWWKVVCAMAEYVAYGYGDDEMEEEIVRGFLETKGYSKESIEKALDWLDIASLTGNISDVFSMVNSTENMMRIANPIEKMDIPEELWNKLETLRLKGLINSDLAERLVEGIRSIDTRDWEEDEIEMFLHDILTTSMPFVSETQLKSILQGCGQEFYS